eukprot:UN2245
MLDWYLTPFFEQGEFGKLIWRESLPQHWLTSTGSGTYDDFVETMKHAADFHKAGDDGICAAITDTGRANWRNEIFGEWLAKRSAVWRQHLRVVPAFEYFLNRHDLHTATDCTHFLYSPFTWAKVWDGMAAVLEQSQ